MIVFYLYDNKTSQSSQDFSAAFKADFNAEFALIYFAWISIN